MEILKRITFTTLFILSTLLTFAQPGAILQRAFQKSYADEYKKDYPAAIADMMPYYSDNSYEVNIRLGWLHYLNKNYDASQTYYLRSVNLRPGAIEAKFGYVKPLSYLQNWPKVLEQYTEIIRIDPQNTQANYWAGVIYYNRKQFDEAIACFRVVATLYPFDYDGNHMLAWSYLMRGKKEEARNYFEKALLIKPDDASSTDGLSRVK